MIADAKQAQLHRALVTLANPAHRLTRAILAKLLLRHVSASLLYSLSALHNATENQFQNNITLIRLMFIPTANLSVLPQITLLSENLHSAAVHYAPHPV